MAEQRRKPSKPEPQPETAKKKNTDATVHLSAEELRAISGGGSTILSGPKPRDLTKP